MKRWLLGVLALLVLAGAGFVAADRYAQTRATAEVETLLAAHGSQASTHGAIAYSLMGDRLTVETLAATADDPALRSWRNIRIGHIEIEGLDPLRIKRFLSGRWSNLAGPLSPDRVTGDAIAIEATDGAVHSAEHLTVTEPHVDPVMTLTGVPVGIAAFATLSAKRLELSHYRATQAAPHLDVTIDSLSVSGLRRGLIERLDLKQFVLDGHESDGTVHLSFTGALASGLDIPAIAALSDMRAEATLRRLTDELALADLELRSPDADIKLRRFSLAGAKAKRPGTRAEIPYSAALSRMDLEQLAIATHKNRPTRVTLDRAQFTGVAPGGVESASMTGLAVETDEDIRFTLASIGLERLAYGDWTRVGTISPQITLQRLGLGKAKLAKGAQTLGGMEEFLLTMTVNEGGMPIAAAVKMARITVSPDTLKQNTLGQEIIALGYGTAGLDFTADSTYDPASQTATVRETLSATPQVGRITMTAHLGNVPSDLQAAEPAEQMRRALLMTFEKLELRYDDESLTDRIIRHIAGKSGGTPEQLRAGLITQLQALQNAMGKDAKTGAMIDVAIGFIREPHSLTLAINPPRPLTLQQLIGLSNTRPDTIPGLLGMSLR